jgi:hypothetical protein
LVRGRLLRGEVQGRWITAREEGDLMGHLEPAELLLEEVDVAAQHSNRFSKGGLLRCHTHSKHVTVQSHGMGVLSRVEKPESPKDSVPQVKGQPRGHKGRGLLQQGGQEVERRQVVIRYRVDKNRDERVRDHSESSI